MGILDRLAELRLPIAIAAASAAALFSLLSLGPSFPTVVGFFWPLLLSTGCFLAAVFVLFRISPPHADDGSADRACEEIIDYVAGQPIETEELEGEPGGAEEAAEEAGVTAAEEEHRKSV